MKALLGFFVALAAATLVVGSPEFINKKVTAETQGETERYRRWSMWPFSSDPKEYSCQISPYVTFYPADNSPPMPAYLCSNGVIELLIATRSFNLGRGGYEYATYANANIDPSILHIEYPGRFAETQPSMIYKHSKGTPATPVVEITGMLLLTDGGIQRERKLFQFMNPTLYNCHFLPHVNFFTEHFGDLPVYRCLRGKDEILIASESFRGPNDPMEWSDILELNIGNDILDVYYPGSFTPVAMNKYRPNPGLTHKGGQFFVQGLLRLADF